MEAIAAEAVRAIAPTLVALAAWRQARAGRRDSAATREIVTGNGHGTVTTLAESTSALSVEILERLTVMDGRLTSALRWQGAHQADHERKDRP